MMGAQRAAHLRMSLVRYDPDDAPSSPDADQAATPIMLFGENGIYAFTARTMRAFVRDSYKVKEL